MKNEVKQREIAVRPKYSLVIVRKNSYRNNKIWKYVLAFFAGGINGFFGGGAGMLIVPLLNKFFNLSVKKSHATAVFVVLPLCVISIVTYMLLGKFNFSNGWGVCIGVVIGGVCGAVLLKKLKVKFINFLFFLVVLFSGLKLLYDSVAELI